ncbi:MAG: SRPBCC domain-containing protein [Candidatus Saccharimonadaceae bacterium]
MEKIIVQTNLNSDILKVWDYYTNPTHITHWNFALDSWHCPKAQNELRVGGKFMSRMEAKDGSEGFNFEGTYFDLLLGKKIFYVMEDGRNVIVDFKINDEDNVDVVVTFDAESKNSLNMQKEGWQNILDNFKKYVESN